MEISVFRITLIFLLFVFLPLSLRAAVPTFLERGAESFAAGDYQQAVTAFTDAEKKSPNDLRITYNLGAAQAASGNFADAVPTLRKSALSKDAELAAKSLTLLGDIAVTQARLMVVPPPGETPPQDRQAIFEHLAAAERVYVEAMELRPSEAESLCRNVEQIRAWKNRAESDWNLADREKKRQELELPQRLDWLEQWQRKIRADLKRTAAEPDSPKKFQVFYEASKEQQRLLEELPPLKESLRQTLPEEAGPPFVSAVGKVGETAGAANNALREMQGKAALDAVTTTVERLDFLKSCLHPFEAIVQDAAAKQESLCKANSADADFDEQAWEQNFVAVRMPLMLDKAKQEAPPQPSDDPEVQGQAENLTKAKELAVRYAPEIESLADEAAELLRAKNPDAAQPKQERALELLREILKHLQQNQDQRQDEEQDEKQDQDKKENQNEQDSKDRQHQSAEQEQNESETKEEEKKSDGKEQAPQEKKEELEKAERLLRQVKRRQQSADERREKVRALLMQLEPVDKDW